MYKVMITGLIISVFLLGIVNITSAGEIGSSGVQIASPDQLVNQELLLALKIRVTREAKFWNVKSWLDLVCRAPTGAEYRPKCVDAKNLLASTRACELMCCLLAWLPAGLTAQSGV